MKGAPVVHYPVGRTPALGVALVALGAAGIAAVAVRWLAGGPLALDWRLGGLLALWLAVAGGLWHFWRGQTRRWLVFDGERWSLGEPDAEDRPARLVPLACASVVFDGQRSLLLRLAADRGDPQARRLPAAWLWAARQAAPQHWHLLRSALYSPPVRVPGEPAEQAGSLPV
jgi:hypothetical protein